MQYNKGGFVYILTNINHTVLYTGVTANLKKRIHEHKEKLFKDSFTAKYNCDQLVYYCRYEEITSAITEEKRIKAGSRNKKIDLINSFNPQWKDLWEDIIKMDL